MIDSFVLLAPILMLGVIALLGFVGCSYNPPRAADPEPEPTTVDIVATVPSGSPTIDSVSTDYGTARAGSSLSIVTAEPDRLEVSNALFGTDFHIREGFIEFDTSSIPVTAVIEAATLTLTSFRDEGAAALNQTVEVRIRDFGATFEATDFVPGANLSALTLVASRAVEPSTRDIWTPEPFDDVALAFHIVKGGMTRIIIHDKMTGMGTQPSPGTAQSDCTFCSPAYGTVPFRPKLTVKYHPE
jgi:hypothetical protein